MGTTSTGVSADEPRLARAQAWLRARGREPFAFQQQAWSAHWAGESGLINAGTGSGKTLAAWLGPLLTDAQSDGLQVLWITPLRALAADLELALSEPLRELRPDWRVEQRTGDTSASVRARQRRKPPQALITTPESLSVLLSYEGAQEQLGHLSTVIVDEWHELLGSKRGVQLELALERLRTFNPALRTWGLSATLPDLPHAMQVLLGPGRPGRLIVSTIRKDYRIDSVLPASIERFPWSGHLGLRLLPDVVKIVEESRSTLIFTNTRSQAEIWYQALLSARLDWLTSLGLHHGSIDAKIRRKVETGIKDGSLRAVVCTSSLDLGVDFPPVDRVIQIGSPKGVSRLLQRAGRSGHRPGETARVTLVPTHAWELVEAAGVRQAAQSGLLEKREGLTLCLDVLAQHLVTVATGTGFSPSALCVEVRRTHAFAALSDAQWQWTLDFVSRGGAALHAYPQFRRVQIQDDRATVAGADIARRHRMSIGTITSDASVKVQWARGGVLGQIEESFLGKIRPRDVFVFGGRVLELIRLKDSTAYVRAAQRRSRFVPRWQGTRLPLSGALGAAVLQMLGERPDEPELRAVAPLLELQRRMSALPGTDLLLVERQRSRDGWHLFVFPFAGRMVNEGIATLMAARAAQSRPRTFSVTTSEYGFELLSDEDFGADAEQLREWARPESLTAALTLSLNASELARRQFRDIARISGLVDPGTPRRGKTARQLQVSSALMFDVLDRHDPENLLLQQARDEVLTAQLAYRELDAALRRMQSMRWQVTEPERLTPLSFPLWADRLQTQLVSSEDWQSRVQRAAERLERSTL
jgi:ATP-dependent helicase Lhr and Lhr-like helicase